MAVAGAITAQERLGPSQPFYTTSHTAVAQSAKSPHPLSQLFRRGFFGFAAFASLGIVGAGLNR